MESHRVARYLTSRRNLVGCSLALLAVVLLWLDPVGPIGIVLVVAFYLLGAAAVRSSPSSTRRPQAADSSSPRADRYGFDPQQVEKTLQQVIHDVSGRVPVDVITRLQRIELITRTQVLPRLDALPPGSFDLYLVERTACDYVPTAIDNYLRLPAGYVSPARASEGVTPLQVVVDELDLLEAGMRRIAGEVQRADMDRSLAHRRFLSDRLDPVDAPDPLDRVDASG